MKVKENQGNERKKVEAGTKSLWIMKSKCVNGCIC
jgi:hypothetical protein